MDPEAEEFRWDGTPLDLPELDSVAKAISADVTPGTARFNFTMNAYIIRHFLGDKWFTKHIYLTAHQDSYLRPSFSADDDVDPRYSVLFLELAEMLINLQYVSGFHTVLHHMSLLQIESGLAELHVGRALTEKGVPFKYVEEGDGTTVDIIFAAPDGSPALCEIKCKYEATAFSVGTIRNALTEASRQIGKGNPGVVFVRVPSHWMEVQQEHASKPPEITVPRALIDTVKDQVRKYSRIRKVILYVSTYAYAADWGLSATHTTMEFSNPRNKPPWDAELLSAYEPGDWYSIVRMGERWAKAYRSEIGSA